MRSSGARGRPHASDCYRCRVLARMGMPSASAQRVCDFAISTVQRCWWGSPWVSAAPNPPSPVLGVGCHLMGFFTNALRQGIAMLPQRQRMAQSGYVCKPPAREAARHSC